MTTDAELAVAGTAEAEREVPCRKMDEWPDILTAHEVAAYLRVDYTLVLRLTNRGTLPALRAGRTWRYRRDLVDAALAECHQREEPEAEEP
jgi:excisionase family DNA binding protein